MRKDHTFASQTIDVRGVNKRFTLVSEVRRHIVDDDPEKQGAWVVRNVRRSHSNFGTFRTPSLRGVADTAPYMHDGSLIDLDAVIRHYSEIDTERLHADGEAILSELNLTEQEIADLVAFLESLSSVTQP